MASMQILVWDDNVVAYMLAKYADQIKQVVCNNEHIPKVVRHACLKSCNAFFCLMKSFI
jgi:hypothetical protein